MGTKPKTTKKPLEVKTGAQKAFKRTLTAKPAVVFEHTSIFDSMTDAQRSQAFLWYYEHPELLPDRESAAAVRASKKPVEIKIKFDEGIFERLVCLRPIPDEELEEVDPLLIILSLKDDSCCNGSGDQ